MIYPNHITVCYLGVGRWLVECVDRNASACVWDALGRIQAGKRSAFSLLLSGLLVWLRSWSLFLPSWVQGSARVVN